MWSQGEGMRERGENCAFPADQACILLLPRLAKWRPADRKRPLGARRTTLSGLWDDRCAFERGHYQIRCEWLELAAPLEKHPPLELARAKIRVPRKHLVSHSGKIHGHQAYRFYQAGIFAGCRQRLMHEHAAIERLVLGAYGGQAQVGMEVAARHIGEPQRHVRQ